jgi:hypothetical protein
MKNMKDTKRNGAKSKTGGVQFTPGIMDCKMPLRFSARAFPHIRRPIIGKLQSMQALCFSDCECQKTWSRAGNRA